ncbi:HERV-H LTR-associating protein 2 [Merluccius polli]|uniref:HERV-H LTR-associating protein 2 n=1 Tax=Merluccius polli TaxID=89951 RepID=A0AA47P470_MERPO|nr:HERV-H LTR-associating protein 2 [Merluccius polli]
MTKKGINISTSLWHNTTRKARSLFITEENDSAQQYSDLNSRVSSTWWMSSFGETMAALGSALTQTVVLLMGVVVLLMGVVCVFGGSCLLPCRFQPNSNTTLHWVKKNGKFVNVHSYYKDQDQLGHQDPLYKGRTSLFPDQISGGNASLRLARVDLQDQGTYMCYTRGNPDKYVTLTVRAPVGTVDIMLVNDKVTCKSGGIYPRPELTWSISPRPATALQNTTMVHEDDQGLYDVSGSLRTVYNGTESVYSCSVQNEHGARTATMRQNTPMQSAPKSEVLLPCNASGLADITWTFNHNQPILRKRAGQEKQVETEWQQHVGGLSESGSLLLNTTSAESAGTYTTPGGLCVWGSCLLPCRFQPNSNTILHWVKKNGKDVQVHSYYEDQDQLGHQDPLYKGRTSLFPDQISGGNASLRLARVDLQDQGTYMCYARGNPDQYVTLTGLTQTVVLLMEVVVLLVGVVVLLMVDCVFGGSCLLPCRFQPNSNTLLHWVKKNGEDVNVHSYYYNQDQLKYQDPLYKGRTSLFPDQISGGNASLRLARVDLQDQGTYLCYARGNPDHYVTLTVRAPVGTLYIMLVNHTVTCKSGGIYPRPELTWSISPHPATALQNTTEVHEDDQGLYDVSGSLRTVYTKSVYSCSVQNEHGARTATMRQNRKSFNIYGNRQKCKSKV